MSIVMYDSVTVSEIPSNPPAVAGYVSGSWPNYSELLRLFPGSYHLSIATYSGARARCLDVEPGDAVASDVPNWLRNNAVGPGLPVIYTSASNTQAVVDAAARSGIAREHYLIWSAHYTHEHICAPGVCGYPQADGTQWTDRALGRNLDQSLVSDAFFGARKPPPNMHYDWYYTGPFASPWGNLNERQLVQNYDKLRPHWLRHHRELVNIRIKLQFLAHRLYTVSHEQKNANGAPSWDKWHRGWRYPRLLDRSNAKKLI